MGAEARALGHGGIRLVARASGVREATVSLGVGELEAGTEPLGRARRPGGGRKRAVDLDPGLRQALLALLEPDERGNPVSPLRWTTKSTRTLADELTSQGHWVSADTVGDLLRAEGFSLQGHAKTAEGQRQPDRDAQFWYVNDQVKAHQDTADPVISVDIKKKELVEVPYVSHGPAGNSGWVSVGTDHDTAAFAVEPIRRWWKAAGQCEHPVARRLLITADAGGSNGYRTRAWTAGLAALAAETGLEITCCHFPRGTSKWHKVEHRLFCHLTMNWRERPLTSYEVTVQAIAATTTRTGPRVRAELDDGSYDTGVTIGGHQLKALPLTRHDWHGDWNYTLRPEAGPVSVTLRPEIKTAC
jgi:transposase